MKLYYNPVSSYSMKALMALYEKNVDFTPAVVNLMDPAARAEYEKIYPIGKVPFLAVEDKDNWLVPESSIIIEYIDRHHPGGTKLIPDDPDLARQVRHRDRFMDCYVNDPMQKVFFDGMRPAGKNDPFGVEQAHARLETALTMLDAQMANKTWAMGDAFSMADCAAAPCLFYCKKVHPYDGKKNVVGYANRLMERPSFQKVLKEAQPILAQMGG